MAIYKSIEPLKNNDRYFFPLTSADQVIKKDGSRLETSKGIDADSLGNQKPDYYAVKNQSVQKTGDVMTGELEVPNVIGLLNGCSIKYENGYFYLGYDDKYLQTGGQD